MRRSVLAALAAICLLAPGVRGQSVVTLVPASEEGRYTIEAKVNSVGVRTYYTDESWFVSMSPTTYLFLYENGYIADSDVKGMTTLKMPDGSSVKAATFVIRELAIGERILIKDIPAFVVKKQTVPLVIGSSAFGDLGGVSREGDRIIIGDLDTPGQSPAIDSLDSLKAAAQSHLEASEYEAAASCLESLREKDALNMLSEYQLAVILGMLGRDEDNIAVSTGWLAANEGKSLTMDYWILSGLGASYAKTGDNATAASCLEKAVASYLSLFNTSEKAVKAGDFKDENLGATLYRLGRVYAAEGKLSKAESRCALAAKCGNESAIDFCKRYKIKY